MAAARGKYRVTLTAAERTAVQDVLRAGKAAARTHTPARMLLTADEAGGGRGWSDARMAEALAVSLATIARVRRRCLGGGAGAALRPRPRPTAPATKRAGRAAAQPVA